MGEMSVEQEIASLATKVAALTANVENITERAKEDRPILFEIRDLAKGTSIKMEGVEKGFAAGAIRFDKIEKIIENHDDRLTVLETWKAEHKGKGGLLNWMLGTLIAIGSLVMLAWTALKMH